jgi:hypothetical protein
MAARKPSAAARAARDRAYSAASDARAGMYSEAEQRHGNRMAAIQRHFGQQITSRGNPDAENALAFVAEIDPAGMWAPIAKPAPIGEVSTVEFAGIKQQRRVDANGRVVAENPVADDGWSNRGTFTGDAAAFMAAKRAGVGLGPEEEPADPGTPVEGRPAEPQAIPEPPPGAARRYRGSFGENRQEMIGHDAAIRPRRGDARYRVARPLGERARGASGEVQRQLWKI